MINSRIRLYNGIMRFARFWAYAVVSGDKRIRIAAKSEESDSNRINKFYVKDDAGNPVRNYQKDKWDQESDLRMEEIYRNTRTKDVSVDQMMERMLRPIVPEIYNVALNIDSGLADYIKKVKENSLSEEEKNRWEERLRKGLEFREDHVAEQEQIVKETKVKYEKLKEALESNEEDIDSLQDKEKSDGLSDSEEEELSQLLKDKQILQEAFDEAEKSYQDAQKLLQNKQSRLDEYKSLGQQKSLDVLEQRYKDFHEVVSQPYAAQKKIFNSLMEDASNILGSVNLSRIPVKSDPEEIAANMAANLWYALNGFVDGVSKDLKQVENSVAHGMSSDMDMLGTTERGIHGYFTNFDSFLRMCKKWMNDALRRSITFLEGQADQFPTKEDDEGNKVSLEDLITESTYHNEGRHSLNPSNFEEQNIQEAIMELAGLDFGSKIRAQMENEAKSILANNPLEYAAFVKWMDKVSTLKEMAKDVKLADERSLDLSNDFYQSLWAKALTNPKLLEAVRQNRLSSNDRALLALPYEEIQRVAPPEVRKRILNIDGQVVLLKSVSALKELFSRVVIPSLVKKIPQLMQAAIVSLSKDINIDEFEDPNEADEAKRFSDLSKELLKLNPEELMDKIMVNFGQSKKSRTSSIDIVAELMRVAKLLRNL